VSLVSPAWWWRRFLALFLPLFILSPPAPGVIILLPLDRPYFGLFLPLLGLIFPYFSLINPYYPLFAPNVAWCATFHYCGEKTLFYLNGWSFHCRQGISYLISFQIPAGIESFENISPLLTFLSHW
jgi:hypothetical protein